MDPPIYYDVAIATGMLEANYFGGLRGLCPPDKLIPQIVQDLLIVWFTTWLKPEGPGGLGPVGIFDF